MKSETGTKIAKQLIGKVMACDPGDAINLTDAEYKALVDAMPQVEEDEAWYEWFDSIDSPKVDPNCGRRILWVDGRFLIEADDVDGKFLVGVDEKVCRS